MRPGGCAATLGCALVLCAPLRPEAQCLDLAHGTRLYEAQSRFRERWNKPIWNAKPGEGNFHVEDEGFGRALQLAIFSAGIVRKTQEGWAPYHARRRPLILVDPTPQRSGSLTFMPAYEKVPPTALIMAAFDGDLETWSLSRDGLLRYTRHSRGKPKILENRYPEPLPSIDFEYADGEELNTATLDLNTGVYHYIQQNYCDGCYWRRFEGGIKLWRTIMLDAKAVLREVPCPASVQAECPCAARLPMNRSKSR